MRRPFLGAGAALFLALAAPAEADISYAPHLWRQAEFIGGPLATLGAATVSGCTPGTYIGVALTGAAYGVGAVAIVTISAPNAATITLTNAGAPLSALGGRQGYLTTDVLTATVGGCATFAAPVASVQSYAWTPPLFLSSAFVDETGGGGGGGGGQAAASTAGGGGGGSGATYHNCAFGIAFGATLTITPGQPGAGGVAGASGTAGTASTISGALDPVPPISGGQGGSAGASGVGGGGGAGGSPGQGAGGAAATIGGTAVAPQNACYLGGGGGGGGGGTASSPGAGGNTNIGPYANAAAGTGSGGGGGGARGLLGDGGRGGNGSPTYTAGQSPATGFGGGGGGGGANFAGANGNPGVIDVRW